MLNHSFIKPINSVYYYILELFYIYKQEFNINVYHVLSLMITLAIIAYLKVTLYHNNLFTQWK